MKCVDMFFWEIGYEMDLVNKINQDQKDTKLKKLIKQAEKIHILEEGCKENDAKKFLENYSIKL